MTRETDISLVLGSGGARGLAHIGAINELERRGYRIRSIAGCSIGAVIGGMYAVGKLPSFENWVRNLKPNEMMTLLDPTWGRGGFVKGDRIMSRLREFIGDIEIEALPISYTAVAADIRREKEVWLNQGNLSEAIRASISLPLFFTPFQHGAGYLIDGGVLNPVPIAPTFRDPTEITIAVNLGGAMEKPGAGEATVSDEVQEQQQRGYVHEEGFEAYIPEAEKPDAEDAHADSLYDRVKGYVSRLQQFASTDDEPDWGMYEIANQAFDAMQSTIARHKLAAYPPDMVIEIPRNVCGMFEFNRAAELIELGHQRTREAIDHFERRTRTHAR